MLSAEPLEPATEYPTVVPIDPAPSVSGLSPARKTINAKILVHGAVRTIRLSLQHNARAYVGLNRAPATYVARQLRLGAIASREARRMLEEALELLRPDIPPHPGIRPGCHFLPRYPKPRDQREFNSWIPMVYYRLFLSPILRDGRMLAGIPERLVPVEAPRIKGLVIFGAELKGAGTRYYGAWTEWGGTFIGWMRTRPNFAGGEQDSIHAIGEVLGRAVFGAGDEPRNSLQDVTNSFQRALMEAADDLGVT
jgi:hypothetical protein